MAPSDIRETCWRMIAEHVSSDVFDRLTNVHPLEAAPDLGEKILRGEIAGRAVIDVNA